MFNVDFCLDIILCIKNIYGSCHTHSGKSAAARTLCLDLLLGCPVHDPLLFLAVAMAWPAPLDVRQFYTSFFFLLAVDNHFSRCFRNDGN